MLALCVSSIKRLSFCRRTSTPADSSHQRPARQIAKSIEACSFAALNYSASAAIIALAPNRWILILLVDALLLVLGMFLDAISICYIMMPMLIPVLAGHGIDPVWYGVVFVSALAIGQATPPVGVNLFTAASLSGCEVDSIARQAVPFVAAAALVLVIISLFPGLSLWIPRLAGLH